MNIPIMSYDEYKALGKHAVPYYVKVEKDNQCLFYMGIHHTHNPTNPQHDEIESFWNEFIEKTQGENCTALTEGGKRPSLKTKEEAIKVGGEAHFLAFLAGQKNIPVDTPEPSDAYKFEQLLKSFTKDQIEYYYFVMIIPQWYRLNPRPDFAQYVQRYLEKDKEASNWNDYDFSIEHMIEIHEKQFGGKFNPNDGSFFNSIDDPTVTPTITNLVSRADTQIRDEHIVKEIIKYWNEGKNIFSVFGCSHVIMQEPALKELINYNYDQRNSF